MIKIRLRNQETFPWINFNDCIYIRGYFYDKNNKVLNVKSLFNKLSNISCQSDLVKFKKIDGCFSIIILIKSRNSAIIASDRIRSFPIFYFIYDSKFSFVIILKKQHKF